MRPLIKILILLTLVVLLTPGRAHAEDSSSKQLISALQSARAQLIEVGANIDSTKSRDAFIDAARTVGMVKFLVGKRPTSAELKIQILDLEETVYLTGKLLKQHSGIVQNSRS